MEICISHRTALSYLLRVPCLRPVGARPSRASAVPAKLPPSERVEALYEALLPNLAEGTERLNLLVSKREGRHKCPRAWARLSVGDLPEGSFISDVAYGISFHVCAPELVFLQLASELELDHLIYAGYALCSEFRLDDLEPGGCLRRSGSDEPLTSVARIRAYLERTAPGTRGRARALRALDYVRDGARSPREAGLAMAIGLPLRLGGYALGEVELNREIHVYDGVDARGEARWVTRIPDILVSARDERGRTRRVGVDFDAASTHMSPERVLSDVDRRNLLASQDDFAHITIGTVQVRNYVAFCREMDRVRRALGRRRKPRLKGDPDSERNRLLLSRTASRQFDLWDRILGSSCLAL